MSLYDYNGEYYYEVGDCLLIVILNEKNPWGMNVSVELTEEILEQMAERLENGVELEQIIFKIGEEIVFDYNNGFFKGDKSKVCTFIKSLKNHLNKALIREIKEIDNRVKELNVLLKKSRQPQIMLQIGQLEEIKEKLKHDIEERDRIIKLVEELVCIN